jgi:hypothetical protein
MSLQSKGKGELRELQMNIFLQIDQPFQTLEYPPYPDFFFMLCFINLYFQFDWMNFWGATMQTS